MHWQHSIHRCWEILLPSRPPHKKNRERYFHDNNGGCASSALRFHQCREGKNKSWVISWVARVFDFVTNCWFWVFFFKKTFRIRSEPSPFFGGKFWKIRIKELVPVLTVSESSKNQGVSWNDQHRPDSSIHGYLNSFRAFDKHGYNIRTNSLIFEKHGVYQPQELPWWPLHLSFLDTRPTPVISSC